MPADTQEPLIAHLAELRRRFFIAVAAWLAAAVLCYAFRDAIYQFFVAPLASHIGGETGRRLIYTGMAEAFLTYVSLAVWVGFALAFPVIAYQCYAFLARGLYPPERAALRRGLCASPFLFALGVWFAHRWVFPAAWGFFLGFERQDAGGIPMMLEARISEYIGFSLQLMLGFGLAFQLPVVMLALIRLGIVPPEAFARKRRVAIIGILVLAAFLTPPDVLSQIMLALPLYLLYEGTIWWAKRKAIPC